MRKVFLMIGIPGSGKSTWVKKRLDETATWISRDNIRFSLLGENADYHSQEKKVVKIFKDEIRLACGNDNIESIYIDATHLTMKSRQKIIRIVEEYNLPIVAVNFCVPLEVAIERNAEREGRAFVPVDVIKKFNTIKEEPERDEGFWQIWNLKEF